MEAVLSSPKELLAARLEDPEVVDSLNRLLDQAPLLAFGAEALSGFIKNGDAITESISQQVSELRELKVFPESLHLTETIPQMYKAGTGLAEIAGKPAFQNLLKSGLIDELGKPETIDLLKRLMGKLELIVFAVEAVDGFLRRGEEIMDSTRDALQDGIRLLPDEASVERLKTLAASAPRLLETGMRLLDDGLVGKLEQLSNAATQVSAAGLLEPAAVRTLATMGTTLAESFRETQQKAARKQIKKVGLFDLIGVLGEPDVQRSLGFLVEFSKRYGEKIKVPQGA